MRRNEKQFDENLQCEKIFQFLNPDSNDLISKMNEKDLKQFIILLNKYYLVLRYKLGFNNDISFGLEMEFEHADRYQIDHQLFHQLHGKGYVTISDTSLEDGGEVSTPILYDNEETWKTIEEVCNIIRKWAIVGKNTGGHIHVGSQVLGDKSEYWINFLRLWSVYENIIYRFTDGEYLTARPSMEEYAAPVARFFWKNAQRFENKKLDLFELLNSLKVNSGNDAVEFNHVKIRNSSVFSLGNTVEFRCPNGTLDSVIWQNNLNLFVNLMLYSTKSSYDYDAIYKRHLNNLDRYFSMDMYNKIYLDVALEFCDIVFDSNIDKIYFLRQYLKNFQTSKGNVYKKARKMTIR